MPSRALLTQSDVAYEPASMADPSGRVFRYDGGLYRAIRPEAAQRYRDLLAHPRCTALFDLGLIDTEISDLQLEGAGLVLRHRELPYVTYALEWCAPMLRDAARLTLDLAIELDQFGCELLDAHPWNVLFEGSSPRFIDFGSIVPAKPGSAWQAQKEFINTFINPLRLLIAGRGDTARRLMTRPRVWGVRDQETAELLGWRDRAVHWWDKRTVLPRTDEPRTRALRKLRGYLDRLEIPSPSTEWSGYYNEYVDLDAPDTWTAKQRYVDDVLRRTQPRTALDLAANAGWFSRLAERHGCTVVATDNDETCLAQLYDLSRAQRLNILPVYQDFTHPAPTYGPADVFPDAYSRFGADLVIALAITHHLVFKAGLNLEQIAQTLARFAGKDLLVEFVPREDRHVAQWYSDRYAWYSLENFMNALSRYFETLHVVPSNVAPRVLITGRARQSAGNATRAA